jgi:hypothetical protein
MNVSLDRECILSSLKTLAAADTKFCVFGSNGHNYKLHQPLSDSIVADLESRYAIKLPDDYRNFITQIGNGGAGPAYGLFKFGEHDDGYGHRKWDGSYLIGDIAKQFRHTELWNHTPEFWAARPEFDDDTPENEVDRLGDHWTNLLEAEYWNGSVMDGAIPICHLGCAYRQWLVVNGPQYSFVWNDDRADNRGLSPLLDSRDNQMTFTDWYLGWLSDSMSELNLT